jgi:hypothetical protein
MNPKRFLWLLTAILLVLPHRGLAQQPTKIPRLGFLSPFSSSDTPYQSFRDGLRDHGWIEGKNISVQYRYANGAEDRLPSLVAELLDRKVDVIVTSVTTDTLPCEARDYDETDRNGGGRSSYDGHYREPRPARWKYYRFIANGAGA